MNGLDPVALRRELERIEKEIERLTELRKAFHTILNAADYRQQAKEAEPENNTTIAIATAQILGASSMDINEIRERLGKRGIVVTHKNLGKVLNRWVRKGKRFERPAPNTFKVL